jgi:hypothetical protein
MDRLRLLIPRGTGKARHFGYHFAALGLLGLEVSYCGNDCTKFCSGLNWNLIRDAVEFGKLSIRETKNPIPGDGVPLACYSLDLLVFMHDKNPPEACDRTL